MYVIIDETTENVYRVKGDYPLSLLDKLTKAGHKVLVVSTYSHTIKCGYYYKEERYAGDYASSEHTVDMTYYTDPEKAKSMSLDRERLQTVTKKLQRCIDLLNGKE